MDQADEEFEKAKNERQSNPAGSCQSFIGLASQHLNARNIDRAVECFLQAASLYREFPRKINQEHTDRNIWQLLISLSHHVDIEPHYFEILEIAESETSSVTDELDNNTINAITWMVNGLRRSFNNSGPLLEEKASSLEKACWKRVIELRTAIRGEDPSLTVPLEQLANACERCGDIIEAEQSFLRADKVAPTENKLTLAQRQLRLAQFYIRQNHPEKLDETQKQLSALLREEPGHYCRSLVDLAQTYKTIHNDENAKTCYNRALALFQEYPVQISEEAADVSIWHYLYSCTEPHEYENELLTLAKIAEQNPAQLPHEVDGYIQAAFRHHIHQDAGLARMNNRRNADKQAASYSALWQKLIDLRSTLRGADSPCLVFLLDNYASACESEDNLAGAEEAYLRADGLVREDSADNLARRKIALAQFYVRHKWFDKAEPAWRHGIELMHESIDEWSAHSIMGLISSFESAKQPSQAKAIITAALESGGTAVCKALDQKLREMCTNLIRIAAFDEAEGLMKLRLAATVYDTEDVWANDWRIRLSDLYLATDRDDDSAALYQQVIGSMALLQLPTDNIRAQRASLLQRLGRIDQATQIQKGLPSTVNKPILLRFGLLASSELRFTHNTRITSYDSTEKKHNPLHSFRPQNTHERDIQLERKGSICSFDILDQGGNFSTDGIIYMMKTHQESQIWRGDSAFEKIRPVPEDLFMLQPAPKALPSDHSKGRHSMGRRSPIAGATPLEKSGDFSASELAHGPIFRTEPGRIRVFLNDDTSSSFISVNTSRASDESPIDCQIFYDGCRTMKVSWARAVIYAPNATVEIEFNGSFAGAIVANRIIAHGNNQIELDTSLIGIQLYP